MKKKKSIDEQQEIKILTKTLNALIKEHIKMKHLVSEANQDLGLLKAIAKHEKKSRKRPEEVYMINVRKRLNSAIETLTKVYDRKKKRTMNPDNSKDVEEVKSALKDLSEIDIH